MLQLSTPITWKMHSFLASQTPIIFSYILLQLITEGDVDLILLPWLDWFSLHESRRSFAWCLFQVTLCYLVPINIPIFIPNKKETKFLILLIGSTANLYNQLFSMSCSTTHSLIHKATKWHLTHNPWFTSLFKQIKAVSPNLASHIIYVLYLS